MLMWITLLRGLFALGLGTAFVVEPNSVRPMIVNFMGIFFLAGGLTSLRMRDAEEGARWLVLAAGCVGIVAGAGTLARFALMRAIPETVVVYLLAAAVFVAGALHIAMARWLRRRRGAMRSWLNVVLGTIELTLATLLITSPLERGTTFHVLLTVWAILAGSLLLVQAWSMLTARRKEALS